MFNELEDLSAYTVILPSGSPVAIFATKHIAERFCNDRYGEEWESKSIRIEKTTNVHIELFVGDLE